MLLRAAGSTSTRRQQIYFRHSDQTQQRRVRMRAKMYVPSDSFGGVSPEKKASQALQSLFTFISAKIVLAQLEGSGRGALAAYNQEQYTVLFSHLQEASLSDSHKWLEQLMRKDKALALRLMEVRDAYSKTDFEWDQLQRLSVDAIKKSNLQLMRQAAAASLQATVTAAEPQAVLAAEQQRQLQGEQEETCAAVRAGIESIGTSAANSSASDEDGNACASSDTTPEPEAQQAGTGSGTLGEDDSTATQQEQQ